MFIPVPDTIKVATQFLGYHKPFYVNQYVTIPGAGIPSPIMFEELRDVLESVYSELWDSYVSDEISIGGWGMSDGSLPDGLSAFLTPTSPIVGVIDTPRDVATVSAVLSWRTGYAGRSKRGRNYFPGWGFVPIDGERWNNTQITAMNAFGDGLIEALDTAGFNLVVASKFAAGVPRAFAITTEVTDCIVNPIPGTVRLRLQ